MFKVSLDSESWLIKKIFFFQFQYTFSEIITRPTIALRITFGLTTFGTHPQTNRDINFYGFEEKVIFKLSMYLALNVTFEKIAIGYMNFYREDIGSVAVKDANFSFTFWGTHSMVDIYTHSCNVLVTIQAEPRVQYDVHAMYSVIDQQTLASFSHNINNITKKPSLGVHFISMDISLFWFHFEFLKVYRVQLKVRQATQKPFSQFHVHDGPGKKNKVVGQIFKTNNEYVFITTTFQCLVTVWSLNSKIQGMNLIAGATGRPEAHEKCRSTINSNNSVIVFSSKTKVNNTNPYFVEIIPSSFHVNITIKNIKHKGVVNVDCLYAGLAVYEIQSSAQELSTVCHADQQYKHRPVYSSYASVLLVFYAYSEYGHVSISLSASTTKCKVMKINICVFNYPCELTNNMDCSFLQSSPHLQSNCFPSKEGKHYPCLARLDIDRATTNANIHLKNESCMVVQLNHDTKQFTSFPTVVDRIMRGSKFSMESCILRKIKPIVSEPRTVKVFISGFLSGTFQDTL